MPAKTKDNGGPPVRGLPRLSMAFALLVLMQSSGCDRDARENGRLANRKDWVEIRLGGRKWVYLDSRGAACRIITSAPAQDGSGGHAEFCFVTPCCGQEVTRLVTMLSPIMKAYGRDRVPPGDEGEGVAADKSTGYRLRYGSGPDVHEAFLTDYDEWASDLLNGVMREVLAIAQNDLCLAVWSSEKGERAAARGEVGKAGDLYGEAVGHLVSWDRGVRRRRKRPGLIIEPPGRLGLLGRLVREPSWKEEDFLNFCRREYREAMESALLISVEQRPRAYIVHFRQGPSMDPPLPESLDGQLLKEILTWAQGPPEPQAVCPIRDRAFESPNHVPRRPPGFSIALRWMREDRPRPRIFLASQSRVSLLESMAEPEKWLWAMIARDEYAGVMDQLRSQGVHLSSGLSPKPDAAARGCVVYFDDASAGSFHWAVGDDREGAKALRRIQKALQPHNRWILDPAIDEVGGDAARKANPN